MPCMESRSKTPMRSWLLARVRRSRSGDVYFLIQSTDTKRDVHASYHQSGERHLRSSGWKQFPVPSETRCFVPRSRDRLRFGSSSRTSFICGCMPRRGLRRSIRDSRSRPAGSRTRGGSDRRGRPAILGPVEGARSPKAHHGPSPLDRDYSVARAR